MMSNTNKIGDKHEIRVCATMVTKPIAAYDIYDIDEPWLIYEWGTDYSGRRIKINSMTLLDLYTKSHYLFYKFTRRDIWGCIRATT